MHRTAFSKTRLAVIGMAGLLLAGAASAEVYIPEGSAGTALRLDANFAAAGRISGLGNVHGMTVALSRNLLISASLDMQSREKIKKPEGMSDADHQAHHSKAKKAMDGKVSLISLIDLKTGSVIRRIEVPGMVHHVTIGGNDRYVLATHPSLGSVSIIDLSTDRVTATIPTGPMPNYAVYDPKTAAFYVSNAGNKTISRVDPVAGVVTQNFKTPGGVEHLAIDVPGRRLFAAEADAGELSVLNIDTGTVIATTQIGGELHGVAYDAGRDVVYVSAREKGAIARIDLKTGVLTLDPIGPEPYHMALDGGTLLVSSAGKKLVWVLDVASGKVVKTIPTNSRGHQMVVIPQL